MQVTFYIDFEVSNQYRTKPVAYLTLDAVEAKVPLHLGKEHFTGVVF